jgi:hypothetical protein
VSRFSYFPDFSEFSGCFKFRGGKTLFATLHTVTNVTGFAVSGLSAPWFTFFLGGRLCASWDSLLTKGHFLPGDLKFRNFSENQSPPLQCHTTVDDNGAFPGVVFKRAAGERQQAESSMTARSSASQEDLVASALSLKPTPAVARANKKKRDCDYKKRRRPQVSEEALAKRRAAAEKRAKDRAMMPITKRKAAKQKKTTALVQIWYERKTPAYNGGRGPQPKMRQFTSGRMMVNVNSPLHEAAKARKIVGSTKYRMC